MPAAREPGAAMKGNQLPSSSHASATRPGSRAIEAHHASIRRAPRRARRRRGLHAAALLQPELFGSNKAEPVQAKRYAVVLNRHCYRGFSGIDYRNKDSYVGTQRAVDMQLALINSVLGNVILPSSTSVLMSASS